MHRAAYYAVVLCLSVRLSIRPSLTIVYRIETNKHTLKLFHLLVTHSRFLT